jgi:hypothetical protein
MKFFATPNLYIKISNKYIQRATNMKGFYFDANGEYVTDKPCIINALKPLYRYEDDTNITKEETEAPAPVFVETKHKCKQCGFEADNKGLLMAHYREHKKEATDNVK